MKNTHIIICICIALVIALSLIIWNPLEITGAGSNDTSTSDNSGLSGQNSSITDQKPADTSGNMPNGTQSAKTGSIKYQIYDKNTNKYLNDINVTLYRYGYNETTGTYGILGIAQAARNPINSSNSGLLGIPTFNFENVPSREGYLYIIVVEKDGRTWVSDFPKVPDSDTVNQLGMDFGS